MPGTMQLASIEDTRTYVNQQLESIRQSCKSITGTVRSHVIHSSRILSTLTSMMEEGMILLDKDNKVVIFNPAASQLFGVQEKDALGRSFDQILVNSCNVRVRDSDIVADKDKFRLLLARRSPDADIINAQLRRELEIRDMAMWNFPLPSIYTDLEGNKARVSRELCTKLMRDVDTLSAANIRELIPEMYHRWYFRPEDRSSTGMILQIGDEEVTLTAHKSLVRDSAGVPIGFITCFTDATHPSEESEFVASFVRAFDTLQSPMVLVSFVEGRVLLANKAFCNNYHFDRKTFVNSNIESVYSCHDKVHRSFYRTLIRKGIATQTFRIVDGYGVRRLRTVHGMAVNTSKGKRGVPKYCLLSEV